MNHDAQLAQADIYALGALDGDELREFETHLASGCPECAARIGEAREALALLPAALAPLAPPPEVKGRLLAEIARERRSGALAPRPAAPVTEEGPGGPRWISWGGWAVALAAAGLLVVVGWDLSKTRQELERLTNRVGVLQDQLTEREATLRFLSDPRVRYVSLAGLPASPDASGWLLWNPDTRQGLFLTRGLPPAPAGRAYELWAIAGSEPVPAGVFGVDRGGRGPPPPSPPPRAPPA